jgi:hypothetical protein
MSEPIEAMIDLIKFHNVTKINELPGAWVQKVDDSWIVAANGHREEIEVKPDGTMGCKLQPFEFAIWYNGWLASIMGALGDGFFADGEGANTETFAQAVRKHIELLTQAKED